MSSKRSLISRVGITIITGASQIYMGQGWSVEVTRIEPGVGCSTESTVCEKRAGVEIQGSQLAGYGYDRIEDGVDCRLESAVARSSHTGGSYVEYRLVMPDYDRIDGSVDTLDSCTGTRLDHFVGLWRHHM
jgi:hypothetical protein